MLPWGTRNIYRAKIAQRICCERVNDLYIIYIARISLYAKQRQGVMPI